MKVHRPKNLTGNFENNEFGINDYIQYNWPYDFFSLVELIKLDAKVDFGNIDSEESQRLDDTILLPTQPTIKS